MYNMNFEDKFSQVDIPIHGVRLPEFVVDKEYRQQYSLKDDSTNYEFLRALCLEGFFNLKLEKNSEEYKKYAERVKYELEIFKDLGFVDYVLLVWDVINYCNTNGIPTGLGRGSAAGSLVLYLIGVTKIDPVRYELYFERFVSKVRAKKQIVDGITYLDGSLMCDVDLDICYYRRPEVLKYLDQKFAGRTSKILTFNTLSSKLLIKECGKVIGEKSEQEMTLVTSMIPKKYGVTKDLEEAYDEVQEFKEWADKNRMIYDTALKLRDLIKNKGVHPSGILVSFGKLEDTCPTELSSDKEIVSSFDMNFVSLLNVKLDVLGLRGVSVVDDVCKSIGIKYTEINLDDPIIYQSLQDVNSPHGLFQIEAEAAFKTVKEVKPKSLEEISAVLALARPGALEYIGKYAKYSNNGDYESIHEFFNDILKPTGGVCLYQEQLMKMVNHIGFTLEDAEQVRRCVGKKKVEEMAKWQSKISDKIQERGLDQSIGDTLWQVAEASANYSFNKSHSISYAALCAITVYLKFKHPKEFFLSLLKMSKHEPNSIEEIGKIQKEMYKFNLNLLPPHLIKSKEDFSIEGDNIRFGLLSIRGISEKKIEKLKNFKLEHANKLELFQAAKDASVDIGTLSALIQAGTLEDFKNSRSFTVYQCQLWNTLTDRERIIAMKYAPQNEYNIVSTLNQIKELKDENGKNLIKPSRIETIKTKSKSYADIYNLNKKSEKLANWWYENKLLGYCCSSSLKGIYDKVEDIKNIREIKQLPIRTKVKFACFVNGKTIKAKSKKGSAYLKIFAKDETDSINVMVFNEKMEAYLEDFQNPPVEEDILIISGTKMDESTVFADIVALQSAKIYTKLSDLKH